MALDGTCWITELRRIHGNLPQNNYYSIYFGFLNHLQEFTNNILDGSENRNISSSNNQCSSFPCFLFNPVTEDGLTAETGITIKNLVLN